MRVQKRELDHHIVVGIGRRDSLLDEPIRRLRLRLEREAKGRLTDNFYAEAPAAMCRAEDGVVVLARL